MARKFLQTDTICRANL